MSKASEFLLGGISRGGLTDEEWLEYLEIEREEFRKVADHLSYPMLCELRFLKGGTSDRQSHSLMQDFEVSTDQTDPLRRRGLFHAAGCYIKSASEEDFSVIEGKKHYPGEYFVWGLTPDALWFLYRVKSSPKGIKGKLYHKATSVDSFGAVGVDYIMIMTGLSVCDICDAIDKDVANAMLRRRRLLDKLIELRDGREHESELRRAAVRSVH